MRVVFLGPPGAGKGTQAARLSARRGVPHLSTGDVLRRAVAEGTPVGRRAKPFMDRGELVPDDVVDAVVEERLARSDAAEGFLLDGYPRNPAQADALDRVLARRGVRLDGVVYVHVDDDELVRRIAGRRVCPKCDDAYHVTSRPPRRAGVCDRCGAALVQRDDDREEVVRRRLAVYHAKTAALVERYREKGLLVRVDGSRSVEEVARAVEEALGEGRGP